MNPGFIWIATVFHYPWDLSGEMEVQGWDNKTPAVALLVSFHEDAGVNSKLLVIIFYLD